MKIRQANRGDAKALGQLVFSSAPSLLAAIFDINDKFSAIKFLQNSLSTADGQYGYANHWVTEIDNKVVACLSTWHSDLAASFHQATLTQLTNFYGIAHALSVVQASLALQDCIPKPKEYELCIGHFAVLSEYQKQGIATDLLGFTQKLAIASGKSTLCLDVESTNSQAINFYLNRDFIQESESDISQRMQTLAIGSHLHLSKESI